MAPGRKLRAEQFAAHLRQAGAALAPLYVIAGDEPLLVIEAGDALRAAARTAGYIDRRSVVMDARSDWQALAAGAGSASLFGDKPLLEIRLPTGKPGKSGSDVLVHMARQAPELQGQTLTVVQLPRLDRTLRATPWFTALAETAVVVEVPTIERQELPAWIGARLAAQGQETSREALQWVADRVEGNLLAAHQEILKLGLMHPSGRLGLEQVQDAVMNVARYNAFKLRDAIQAGDSARVVRMIDGLRAEGEALPLVLWAVMQTWSRTPQAVPPAVVRHAHDIDRLIKGLAVPNRLADPWQELTALALRLTRHSFRS
ncbi:DNA polymerase III subunit delta [Verticiella sediminum]|uniref:DNA polymerase III subunit delta n=1 Tax=Verticiella sediminum TaxID=1247510 RepID=A0A556A7R5_9BURK|nr:DNA polymerase III subunit delta [Verticiella sediminum]TSH88931.1 DNA polymerase III subunit delta [Verticiella sediminum]